MAGKTGEGWSGRMNGMGMPQPMGWGKHVAGIPYAGAACLQSFEHQGPFPCSAIITGLKGQPATPRLFVKWRGMLPVIARGRIGILVHTSGPRRTLRLDAMRPWRHRHLAVHIIVPPLIFSHAHAGKDASAACFPKGVFGPRRQNIALVLHGHGPGGAPNRARADSHGRIPGKSSAARGRRLRSTSCKVNGPADPLPVNFRAILCSWPRTDTIFRSLPTIRGVPTNCQWI